MKKKEYEKPEITVYDMHYGPQILAGSGEDSMEIGGNVEVDDEAW